MDQTLNSKDLVILLLWQVSGLFTFRGSISGERRANGESVQR